MRLASRSFGPIAFSILLSALVLLPLEARAQSCQTASELDDASKTPITTAGQRYFDMAAKGDSAGLRQNSVPSLASDFAGIEAIVKDRQADLAGAQATVKSLFLLDASGEAPLPHAEFYCGVFGKNGQTPTSAAFYLDNLPPGKYAIVLLDASSAKARTMFSEVLQQSGADWKLAGLYVKPAQIAGHDSDWFLAQARQYKSKGQMHNAWFFYEEAISLKSPLSFMGTLATDQLYDESQSTQPADLPANGKTADLAAGTTPYKLSSVYPWMIGNDLDLFVKYLVPDVSNTNQAYQSNLAVMKALVAKYPEVKDAFAGVDAIAIDPNGRDYGTLLAMKDIK